MGKEKNYNGGRRTFPGYMSQGEYERQRSQIDEMVKGITGVTPTTKIETKKTKTVAPTIKVGNTANFCIEVDHKQKTVLIKEKILLYYVPLNCQSNRMKLNM